MTLVEVAVALGLISLIMGLGALLFNRVVRLYGAHGAYCRRLDAADCVLRNVAGDVRDARAFLASTASWTADAQTLILDTAEGQVVYQAAEGVVRRTALAEGRSSSSTMLADPDMQVRFATEAPAPAEARSAVVTVSWREPPSVGISNPTLSLRVALRN